MADRLGQQFGNYRLVSLLGQGGYAEVYLGQHVRLNQQAALKVLHAHLTQAEAEHFQQEAQTIATLVHPGIVRVFDYDVQDGVPFLVIDYAPKETLRRRYPKGSLVPLPVIVAAVKQVADALQYAHEQKFIHRDVKPENMLLGRREEVLLSDFGIATIAHSTSSLSTSAEGTSGTLAYMAPEQIEGHPRPASDQYALAVVVYEWLCGERPFEGSVSEVMAQHLSMPPLPLRERMPTIPAEVEQVVLRALAKDPKARFASVAAFSAALEQASQRALAPTGQLANEQPVLNPEAATSYDTVAAAPSHLVPPTESTPSAELPVGALEPTVYPGSPAPHGRDTPQNGTAVSRLQQGQVVAPTAAVVSPPLEPTMPVQRKARRISSMSVAL
jgi:eukaryotic-like serine/threonine-protein kinase